MAVERPAYPLINTERRVSLFMAVERSLFPLINIKRTVMSTLSKYETIRWICRQSYLHKYALLNHLTYSVHLFLKPIRSIYLSTYKAFAS